MEGIRYRSLKYTERKFAVQFKDSNCIFEVNKSQYSDYLCTFISS